MGTLTTILVWRGVDAYGFSQTEKEAAIIRGYCAWKKANHRPDLVGIARKPASPPALQVVSTKVPHRLSQV